MNALFKKAMIAVVVLPLTFSTVYAKQGGHRGDRGAMPLRYMLSQVDLTSEQKTKVETIVQGYRSEAGMQKNRAASHDDMMAILKAGEFDVQKAEALIASQNAVRNERKLQRMQMMFDVYHELNAEQQAKMDLLFSQHQQKMLKKGNGRGHGKEMNKQEFLN